MSDRELLKMALEALEMAQMNGEAGLRKYETVQIAEAITALRTHLAAEPTKQEPVAWGIRWKNTDGVVNATTDPQLAHEWRRNQVMEVLPLYTAPPAAAPEPVRHPGYVIGNHWLETAYSRICAGEAEDAILEDYELVREPRLRELRRDAERLWQALKRYGKHDDDCGDHDAYNNESMRHCACGLDVVLDETLGDKT